MAAEAAERGAADAVADEAVCDVAAASAEQLTAQLPRRRTPELAARGSSEDVQQTGGSGCAEQSQQQRQQQAGHGAAVAEVGAEHGAGG